MIPRAIKFRFFEILLLAALFCFSVLFRSYNLWSPPSQHYEWMSSHVLVTMKVWDKTGGPSQSNFAPRFTFPEKGNRQLGLGHLPGLYDAQGNYYYISYPSLAFLLPYYVFEWSGAGKNHFSLRVFGLLLHGMIVLLLFLFLLELGGERQKADFALIPLLGAASYIFSKVYLWSHMNFYFADSLMQLFFLLQAMMLYRLVKSERDLSFINGLLLFVVFFLGACCDWFGVLTGLAAILIFYRKNRSGFWKKQGLPVWLVGCAILLSLFLTFVQYASIAGVENFGQAISGKMLLRSGWSSQELTTEGLSYFHSASYIRLVSYFWSGFGLFLVPLLFAVMGLLLIKNTWKKLSEVQQKLLLFLGIPVVAHLVLLFNFNVVHDFSVMKYGFFLVVLLVLIFPQVKEKMRSSIPLRALAAAVFFLAIAQNLQRYKEEYSENYTMYAHVGEKIRTYARPDEVVYLNKGYYYNPTLIYYAERNVTTKGNPKLAIRDLQAKGMPKALFVYIREPFVDTMIRLDTNGKMDYIFPEAEEK